MNAIHLAFRLFLVLVLTTTALGSLAASETSKPQAEPQEAISPESRQQAVAVLKRAQRAVGGAEKLREIRDITKRSDLIQDPNPPAVQSLQIILPSTVRLANSISGFDMIAFSDGESGWVSIPYGTNELPDWQVESAHQDVFRQMETLLLSNQVAGRSLAYLHSETVSGKEADVIEITSERGQKVRLWVATATGDPLKLTYQRVSPRGQGGALVEDIFSDYRDQSGLRMPFSITTLTNGLAYMETRLSSVEYNTGLDAAEMARQPPAPDIPQPASAE